MHGNKGRFFISRATKSGQIRRLFYIPYILQPELQHSLDTQIFILALRHYSSLITSTGRNLQEIILQPIFCAIGPEMAATPPPPSQLKVEQTRLESFHEN